MLCHCVRLGFVLSLVSHCACSRYCTSLAFEPVALISRLCAEEFVQSLVSFSSATYPFGLANDGPGLVQLRTGDEGVIRILVESSGLLGQLCNQGVRLVLCEG